MSADNTLLTSNQATTNYDVTKIFVWDNRYIDGQYNNSGYEEVTLALGTLMGRISATQLMVPLNSAATDGSQFPVGILAQGRTVAEGDTIDISICVSGDVAESQVILADGDTMDTVISDRSIRDRIGADTVGIKLVGGTEMTDFDNQ